MDLSSDVVRSPIPRRSRKVWTASKLCFHSATITSVVRSGGEWLRTRQVNPTGTINSRAVPTIDGSKSVIYGESDLIPVNEQHRAMPAHGVDNDGCELHPRIAGCVHGIDSLITGFTA
jgi:hypothetical protein